MPKKKTTGKKRGPEPQRLKIHGDWTAAVSQVMKTGKPKAKKKAAGSRTPARSG